jgi:hypothetical protein
LPAPPITYIFVPSEAYAASDLGVGMSVPVLQLFGVAEIGIRWIPIIEKTKHPITTDEVITFRFTSI